MGLKASLSFQYFLIIFHYNLNNNYLFQGFLGVLKTGGLFLFNLRPSDNCSVDYNKEFEEILKDLENSGKIKVVERKPIPHCTNWDWGGMVATFFTVKKL